MPVAGYPTKLWNWCLLKDEEKGKEHVFNNIS